MSYSKPKSVSMPKAPASFAAGGHVKMVYGRGPSLGHKDCVDNPPPPKPING